MAKTRSKVTKLFLLGMRDNRPIPLFNKLPTLKQVLLRFLYHLEASKSNLDSSYRTAEELLMIWKKASIATRQKHNVAKQVENLHWKWILLKKNKYRTSQTPHTKMIEFIEKLDKLFDIASSKIAAEYQNFLEDQRNERRYTFSSFKCSKRRKPSTISEQIEEITGKSFKMLCCKKT